VGKSWIRIAAVAPGMAVLSLMLISCGSSSGTNPPPGHITVEPAFTSLSFNRPVEMVQAPGDGSVWYLLEKAGLVQMFANESAAASTTISLDLTGRVDDTGEGGLLGMAFHPSFSGSGDVYLYFTETGPGSNPLVSKIARFSMNFSGIIDSTTRSVILSIDQPADNHNAGKITFGPDGFLYIGLGDGGGAPNGRAQDTTTLLGSMLRIDVDKQDPGLNYAIPADNIFANSSTDAPEIFAWGFRNPWRWSFDRVSGDLWTGDVGQNSWEEVDLVVSGGNYGWDIREGDHCYSPPSGCSDAGLTGPVVEYSQAQGDRSITGGYVYRGSSIPALYGTYLFGDWVSGRLRGFNVNQSPPNVFLFKETGLNIASFAEGLDGELYVLDYFGGGIHKIIAAP